MTDPFAPTLAVVTDADGNTVAFGWRQIEWLAERGEVERDPEDDEQLHWLTTVAERTAFELDDMVLGEASLRECDFCTACPADWRLNLRHPVETQLGQLKRAMFACDVCAGYIRNNNKPRLIGYALERLTAHVNERYGLDMDEMRATALVGAQIKRTVQSLFSARKGPPESMVLTDDEKGEVG